MVQLVYIREAVSSCTSDPSTAVVVLTKPSSFYRPNYPVRRKHHNTVSPHLGYMAISNPAVATVTNAGVVTSLAQGMAYFTFTLVVAVFLILHLISR